jgi:CO/xanthine dehydrogenase FAD-binding subunit
MLRGKPASVYAPCVNYVEPETLDEALEVLSQHDGKAKVIAGGTEVLVDMKSKQTPECLVNMKRIPGLSYIEAVDGMIRIGSLTRIRDLEQDPIVCERFTVLCRLHSPNSTCRKGWRL